MRGEVMVHPVSPRGRVKVLLLEKG
jgi:hypothetical protein